MALLKDISEYQGEWPWPNFGTSEIACKCCGDIYLDPDSLDALQLLRDTWGKPIIITSAHRCARHNKAVGGTTNSQHLKLAFDCACPARDQAAFIAKAKEAGFTGIGRYPSRNFVHLDLGPARSWNG